MKELTLKEIEKLLGYKVKVVAEKPADIGGVVNIADIEWIILDKDDEGNLLCLAKDFVYKRTPFDTNTNNYVDSSVRRKLNGDFLRQITKRISKDSLLDIEIDLTSDDGLDDYGKVTDKVGLLTADMYRKYNRIIEKYKVDDWWWLATPWSTPHRGIYSGVRCVSYDGTLSNYSYININGIRPVLFFKSDIFVS